MHMRYIKFGRRRESNILWQKYKIVTHIWTNTGPVFAITYQANNDDKVI